MVTPRLTQACVLDSRRVNALSLRFADIDRPDLPLGPGVHAMGRDGDGVPALNAAQDDALVQLTVDRRGVWMHVRDGARGLHVNGRPVRRVAMLRAGDALHVDGHELTVLGDAPDARAGHDGDQAPRALLRGVGGLHHGRCHRLDGEVIVGSGADAHVRLDAELPAAMARLSPRADGWAVETFDPLQVPRINGHARHTAVLHVGDQLAFGSHRFVVEAPRAVMSHAHVEDVALEPPVSLVANGSSGAAGAMRRMPWLLLAALAMAGSLALLLMYGAR